VLKHKVQQKIKQFQIGAILKKKQDIYADTNRYNGLGNELKLAITLYQGIYPTKRPPTPKQSTSIKLSTIVKKNEQNIIRIYTTNREFLRHSCFNVFFGLNMHHRNITGHTEEQKCHASS
jgi:hypothetical protein